MIHFFHDCLPFDEKIILMGSGAFNRFPSFATDIDGFC
jgi:hypothetical protein